MPKIKITKNEDSLISSFNKNIQRYLELFPIEADSLKLEIKKLDKFIEYGILEKNVYHLFQNQRHQFELNLALTMLREDYIKHYGFFIVSEDFISVSKELLKNKKILEVGAGSGFLSSCLQSQGIDITPTDISTQNNEYGFIKYYTNILEVDSVMHLKENAQLYDTVLMSWPNYGSPFANNILKNMISGQQLLYIGENKHGCTGNDQFFNRLKKHALLLEKETVLLQESSFRWHGLHDRPYLYEIK